MKRYVITIIIFVAVIAGDYFLATRIRYFSFNKRTSGGVTRYELYKNPLYSERNIIVSTDPFVRIDVAKSNKWKWVITIAQKIYPYGVLLRAIDKDTNEVLAKYPVDVSAPGGSTNDAALIEIQTKITDNYPFHELFPYVSSRMIASYSGEPKQILITKKTNADSTVFLQELDGYLKQKSASVAGLAGEGVTFTYSMDTNAVLRQE